MEDAIYFIVLVVKVFVFITWELPVGYIYNDSEKTSKKENEEVGSVWTGATLSVGLGLIAIVAAAMAFPAVGLVAGLVAGAVGICTAARAYRDWMGINPDYSKQKTATEIQAPVTNVGNESPSPSTTPENTTGFEPKRLMYAQDAHSAGPNKTTGVSPTLDTEQIKEETQVRKKIGQQPGSRQQREVILPKQDDISPPPYEPPRRP